MKEKEHGDEKANARLMPEKDTMISHYRIIEKIGAGGMGVVYLAEDTKLKRQVALKFLSSEQTSNRATLKQFALEAQAVARLQHQNIITVFEVNEFENLHFISMAYIKGQSLKELAETRSLSLVEIIEFGIQIADGLSEAHKNGITHRDLKPGNIMIDSSGQLKILDFGLALLSEIETERDSASTVTSNPLANKIAGTILYMAPEQLLGQEITPKVDIFAFGVVMHELLSNEHPFAASSVSEISAKILRDNPGNLYEKQQKIPYDLNRIISRCLNKKPDKRFQTTLDISLELEDLLNDLKQGIAEPAVNNSLTGQGPTLSESTFALTTDLVRKLSYKEPKMIGAKLAYIENSVDSEDLVLFLHGIGHDHRQFSDVIRELPIHAISISLFGFDKDAALRVPITMQDHSILLHALIKKLTSKIRPRRLVLVGFSSGADHFLNFAGSDEFSDIELTGVLSLGCNIHFDDCFASSKFSQMVPGNKDQILSTIKEFSSSSTSLRSWLLLHDYLLTAFSKFGEHPEALRQFAMDIEAPFKDGDLKQFPKWYKNCLARVPHVRFVVDANGYGALDKLMHEHLGNNILGDDFDEATIIREQNSHMELGQPEILLKHTLDFIKKIDTK